MGACVIHGLRLVKRPVRYPDGSTAEELIPEDGGSDFPSYSTVRKTIDFCAKRGAPEEDWPVFSGIWEGDADLEDISSRCSRLREHLLKLNADECARDWWLARVRSWLARGEVFAIFE